MKTYAYFDASNLFYGGEKSLGWKIDYQKLLKYLERKYCVEKAFYFAGVETHNFNFDYMKEEFVDIEKLYKYMIDLIEKEKVRSNLSKVHILKKSLQRVKFYKKLKEFGYILRLKPVKFYKDAAGKIEIKANCDVDMTFYMMKNRDLCNQIIFLSGDGDFLPVLKYLQKLGREIHVLARSLRTAKEIRKFAQQNFIDLGYLRERIKM